MTGLLFACYPIQSQIMQVGLRMNAWVKLHRCNGAMEHTFKSTLHASQNIVPQRDSTCYFGQKEKITSCCMDGLTHPFKQRYRLLANSSIQANQEDIHTIPTHVLASHPRHETKINLSPVLGIYL